MPDWCTRMFLLVIILGANSPIRGEGDFVTNILDNQGDVGRYCNAAVADDGKLIAKATMRYDLPGLKGLTITSRL